MEINVEVGNLTQWRGDGIAVNVFQNETLQGQAADVDRALGGEIQRALDSKEFSARYTIHSAFYSMGKLPAARVAIVGLGKREKFKLDRARRAAADGVKALRKLGAKKVALTIANQGLELTEVAQATAEGVVMGLFRFQRYYTEAANELWDDDFRNQIESATILVDDASQLTSVRAAVERGKILGEANNFARILANEPSNHMTPLLLAEQARVMAEKNGLEFYVIDRAQAEKFGMGAFLGVAQGSVNPPAMIVMRYWGDPDSKEGGLGLIGKGITFDSGGISLKPSEGMENMKGDMSGGAATIAAMQAIAQLKPKINVTGIVAAAENMPGGNAFKPGDILHAMNGKTIEINNTDAEGRLVLADAVAYATKELKLNPVLDAATLTGAIVVALGIYRTGVFSNDDALAETLYEIGEKTGEKNWQMPMDDEYRLSLRSEWADLKNSGGRAGGAITGAWFIRSFVESGAKWAHLDIAGAAGIGEAKERGYINKWGTGTPTRTFVEFALQMANEK
ncbi:MAG: leucyl aminopeptidase [Chloroflexota bacterium]|nr:MAG: leucyl aminopeptidase [Chloroflexota bacterium]